MKASSLLVAIFLANGVAASAQDTSKVTLGAIRWDNWRLDSSYGQVLDDPGLRDRIPYYAVPCSKRKLGFPGDSEPVLDADVHYARSADWTTSYSDIISKVPPGAAVKSKPQR